MTLILLLIVVVLYVALVARRYLFRAQEWGTFQGRTYPLRPWRLPADNRKMVNPMSGWRSRNMPDPTVTEEQFDEVVRCAAARRAGEWLPGPFERFGINPAPPQAFIDQGHLVDDGTMCEQSALLVQMDKPIDLWHVIVDYLASEQVPRVERRTTGDNIDFLWVNRSTLRIAKAMRRAFRAIWRIKYFFGVERPNEHEDAQLGPYPHPDHAADGAGHGTGAGVCAASAWYEYCFEGRMDVWREVLHMCVHWACYRTTGAQVHRMEENLRGIVLGWTTTIYRWHMPLTPYGSWQTGLKDLCEWYPKWNKLA